jgi:hypothetical protein
MQRFIILSVGSVISHLCYKATRPLTYTIINLYHYALVLTPTLNLRSFHIDHIRYAQCLPPRTLL